MKDIKKHFSHYLPLIGMLLFVIAAFAWFSYDKSMLLGSSIALSGAYVSWGVVHHYIHKDLSSEVVFEYVAVAILGLILLISTIYWM
jgi:hypothetical protein